MVYSSSGNLSSLTSCVQSWFYTSLWLMVSVTSTDVCSQAKKCWFLSLLRCSLSLLFCPSGFHGEILIWGTCKWGRVRHLLRRRSSLVVLLINVMPFLKKKIKFHRSAFVIFIGVFFNPYTVIKWSRTRTNVYFTRVLIQH